MPTAEATGRDGRITAVRRFNRFITRHIGVLNEGLLNSSFSPTEMRVLYELAHRQSATAGGLADDLGVDRGYLSRILKRFQDLGLVERRPSAADGRQIDLRMSAHGHAMFRPYEEASSREVAAVLDRMTEDQEIELVAAMATIERLLAGRSPEPGRVVIRPHGIGDLGWVVSRQALLYAREYGWDQSFEGLLAEIAAEFVAKFDPAREAGWIAELDGEPVGSAFVVDGGEGAAKLRLVFVEKEARGHGIGRALVDQAIRFARERGYGRLTLWTNDVLVAARRIYEAAGFVLVEEEPHHSFGHDLIGQYWSLDLGAGR